MMSIRYYERLSWRRPEQWMIKVQYGSTISKQVPEHQLHPRKAECRWIVNPRPRYLGQIKCVGWGYKWRKECIHPPSLWTRIWRSSSRDVTYSSWVDATGSGR